MQSIPFKRFFRPGFVALLALPLLAARCAGDQGAAGEQEDPFFKKITYTELTTAFPNPERGFYYPYDFHFKGGKIPAPITKQTLAQNRTQNRTLVLLEYFLRDFIDKPLSDECLGVIRANMEVLREGGSKCILRFAYSDSDAESAKPWDAEESVVMQHIAQLKPLMQSYGDVIYVLQAGFVGVWGEWYYTDHFGFQPETAEEFQPRRRVVEALLDALPKERMVALRTPQAKLMCFGWTGADSITQSSAYDGSLRSRLACHNDCFLADASDVGTFNSKVERGLWMADARYVSMGGETCGVSSFCACTNSISDLAKYHWSYLNIAYHQGVIKGWRDNVCFDQIECRLGYRLVLTQGSYTREVVAGQPFKATLSLRNAGFAAPVNARGVELVFAAADGSESFTQKLPDDPRYWFAGGSYTISAEFPAPALTAGKAYALSLRLPDPTSTLHSNPLFCIRTANEATWNEQTGGNELYLFTAK